MKQNGLLPYVNSITHTLPTDWKNGIRIPTWICSFGFPIITIQTLHQFTVTFSKTTQKNELIVLSSTQNSSKLDFPSSMVINLWECIHRYLFFLVDNGKNLESSVKSRGVYGCSPLKDISCLLRVYETSCSRGVVFHYVQLWSLFFLGKCSNQAKLTREWVFCSDFSTMYSYYP